MDKSVVHNLRNFKKKYYFNLLLKGVLYSTTILLSAFLFFSLLEYNFYLNSFLRAGIFFGYLGICAFLLYKYWLRLTLNLVWFNKQMSDEDAARQVGGFFPQIKDKLLNIIQLEKEYGEKNGMVQATAAKNNGVYGNINFSSSIHLENNKKYLLYLTLPFLALLLLSFLAPQTITEPSRRYVKYNEKFSPPAPFTFVIQNTNLQAFKNEDFEIVLKLDGEFQSSDAYVIIDGRKIKMQSAGSNLFSFVFRKIQRSEEIRFESAGYLSGFSKINVVSRPFIRNFHVELDYPKYLGMANERQNNIGNVQAPEGTKLVWVFDVLETDSMRLLFEDKQILSQNADNQLISVDKQIFSSQSYQVQLFNRYSSNKNEIRYNIEVIKDKYPQINLEYQQDTILYDLLVMGGNISDDYGLTELALHYQIKDDENVMPFQKLKIAIDKGQNSQSFYYNWKIKDFDLKPGQQLEFYLEVKDNDGINGRKSSKTGVYKLKVPTKNEIDAKISESSKNAENQIEKTIEEAKSLKDQLKEAQDKLKEKQSLDWQDKKRLEDIIEKREKLEEELKNIQEMQKALEAQKERFTPEQSQRIQEKSQQLQELMEEMLDDETKQLYEELQKLLEEQSETNDLQDVLDKLNQKEFNLEKELERSLELFKKMKFDFELQNTIQKAEELEQKQEQLAEETKDKNSDLEDMEQKQEDLQEEFQDLQNDMEDLQELNQQMQKPEPMQDFSQEQQNIEQNMKEAGEQLQNKKRKKASQSQNNAAQQMRKMKEKMQQMQSGMEMTMMSENLGDLRQILDNLVKLSFEQEKVMNEFRGVNQSDPRFLDLSQEQLKIKDDAKIIEDSLLSLANRVFQIKSFVTREVNDMNKYMDDASNSIKQRKKAEAVGKQQFAMTSMNNLALMLDDVLDQMQQAMAEAMGNPNQKGQKPQGMPNLSQLQKQLNDQIQQLKKSGKSGRQLSEDLAKMAAEQEKIRKAMQQLEDELNKQNQGQGGNLDDVIQKMEETETDLVNKRITQETIMRQREILTRLLEAEESLREQELSPEREGERASDYEMVVPKAFEDYIKQKEQEIELLKTVPVQLNPFYKKEVNSYFERIGSE